MAGCGEGRGSDVETKAVSRQCRDMQLGIQVLKIALQLGGTPGLRREKQVSAKLGDP